MYTSIGYDVICNGIELIYLLLQLHACVLSDVRNDEGNPPNEARLLKNSKRRPETQSMDINLITPSALSKTHN